MRAVQVMATFYLAFFAPDIPSFMLFLGAIINGTVLLASCGLRLLPPGAGTPLGRGGVARLNAGYALVLAVMAYVRARRVCISRMGRHSRMHVPYGPPFDICSHTRVRYLMSAGVCNSVLHLAEYAARAIRECISRTGRAHATWGCPDARAIRKCISGCARRYARGFGIALLPLLGLFMLIAVERMWIREHASKLASSSRRGLVVLTRGPSRGARRLLTMGTRALHLRFVPFDGESAGTVREHRARTMTLALEEELRSTPMSPSLRATQAAVETGAADADMSVSWRAALRMREFWLLEFVAFAISGAGLTYINNLGSIALALNNVPGSQVRGARPTSACCARLPWYMYSQGRLRCCGRM